MIPNGALLTVALLGCDHDGREDEGDQGGEDGQAVEHAAQKARDVPRPSDGLGRCDGGVSVHHSLGKRVQWRWIGECGCLMMLRKKRESGGGSGGSFHLVRRLPKPRPGRPGDPACSRIPDATASVPESLETQLIACSDPSKRRLQRGKPWREGSLGQSSPGSWALDQVPSGDPGALLALPAARGAKVGGALAGLSSPRDSDRLLRQ